MRSTTRAWQHFFTQLRIVISGLMMVIFSSVLAFSPLSAGATESVFQPGDLVIYTEDLSGTAPGNRVAGWDILQGSYEVAEFKGKRWFRPLSFDTHILRSIEFPEEFSIEFAGYLSEPGNAELRMFLHSVEDVKAGPGPDGPARVYLTLARYGETDGFRLMVWDARQRRLRDVARNEKAFPPDQIHQVALQVRGKKLQVFIDGQRVAMTPFPAMPLAAISFRFLSRSGHSLPYKDRPALLDAIRVAAYSVPRGEPAGGVRLIWVLPFSQDTLPRPFAQYQASGATHIRKALKQHFGWEEVTLLVETIPANPFPGSRIRAELSSDQGQALVQRIQDRLADARHSGLQGGLLILGDGGDGNTERERQLLASVRAYAFAAWLARQGIGDPLSLLRAPIGAKGAESAIYLDIESNHYQGILF